ncbi:helix-turn-helix transcriptional regulator [Mesorhizobium muleiense]|uniref:helix-turn-helix transcriptional regulator n=1 Tax=Mesorhizobium muleiense TaxID=1004279 RepID=UPI001F2508CC|nr:helix-turn-helix domain-containing protein [Mesorhizobium muleiense]MCF6108964.1 helix-turn-helix domain-containing protein [Mesorhizobium muleiense]
MSKGPADAPHKYLRTKEAAPIVGLCARTLEKHRTYGTGPNYRKVGGRVLYDIDDLHAWIALGARTSTSDTNATVVPPAKPHAARAPAYAGRRNHTS